MPADQVPSDAEVEAAAVLLDELSADAGYLLARAAAEGNGVAQSVLVPSIKGKADKAAEVIRALLRERQAVPARIAAAAEAAFLDGWSCSCEGWNAEYGPDDSDVAKMKATRLALLNATGTDHLTAQLAAAEARGMRREKELIEGISHAANMLSQHLEKYWDQEELPPEADDLLTIMHHLQGCTMTDSTPPAGGADDAG